ncbi:hypothetical protein, unknown function [Leishmania tarentolae]|uniref:Uncharacterized protein n=1 Tax=Leishmania tarentolae TaxID=5689 RepID=A0A640KSN3_LEITA|nr:hypothetical protein, unknown function [Leishmania tarentolae]
MGACECQVSTCRRCIASVAGGLRGGSGGGAVGIKIHALPRPLLQCNVYTATRHPRRFLATTLSIVMRLRWYLVIASRAHGHEYELRLGGASVLSAASDTFVIIVLVKCNARTLLSGSHGRWHMCSPYLPHVRYLCKKKQRRLSTPVHASPVLKAAEMVPQLSATYASAETPPPLVAHDPVLAQYVDKNRRCGYGRGSVLRHTDGVLVEQVSDR